MRDGRKRRDDLADQLGAPVYLDAPEPPFISLTEGMVFLSFAVDPARVAPLLPPGLTLAPSASAILVIVPTGGVGWGIREGVAIFPGISVNEMPSPDTAEACFIPSGLARGPALALQDRHYFPNLPGDATVTREGDAIAAEVRWEGRVVMQARMRLTDQASAHMSSQDRYFGRDGGGDLVQFVVSADGACTGAEVQRLWFAPDGPPGWGALQPVRCNFGLWIPQMLFNMSRPEPVWPDPGESAEASRRALMAILDRQGRACALVRQDGRILAANAAASRLLAPWGGRAGTPEAASPALRAALARAVAAVPPPETAAAGRAAKETAAEAVGMSGSLVLPGADGPALILQALPADPGLAGPGAALVLLDSPGAPPPQPRGEILRLLGLTPAEARIAAAVGAGLPPREAALHLGLAESTVRSSLKVIFGKLGVARQADLVRLVARISG